MNPFLSSFCLLTFFLSNTHLIGVSSQGFFEVIADKAFGNDCLKKVLPEGVCAIVFDDDGCEGWDLTIPTGTLNFKLPYLKSNDIEAVIVRKGCVFSGYDDDGETELERGKKITIDARGHNKEFLAKDLDSDSLKDDIEAVDCVCFDEKKSVSTPASVPVTRTAKAAPTSGRIDPLSNTTPGKCTTPHETVCGMLYDNEDCQLDSWDAPVVLKPGEKRSFSLIASLLNRKYKNEAESILVREGCVLQAFDDSDYSDDGIRLEAKQGDLSVNLESHPNKDFRDLDEDIESVICNCN